MCVSEQRPSSEQHAHRRAAPDSIAVAVLTVSDTRTPETDSGGDLVAELLEEAGQRIACRNIVPDEPEAIQAAARQALEDPEVGAVLLTGGTGVAPRDVTPESVEPLLERVVPGFGEIFRSLSYQEIGSAALLSRALAGIAQGKPVFVLPGSRGAVRLGLTKLVVPEIGHLAAEAQKTR